MSVVAPNADDDHLGMTAHRDVIDDARRFAAQHLDLLSRGVGGDASVGSLGSARGRGVSHGVGWRLVNPKATLFWKVNVVGVHSYGGERFAVVRIRRT